MQCRKPGAWLTACVEIYPGPVSASQCQPVPARASQCQPVPASASQADFVSDLDQCPSASQWQSEMPLGCFGPFSIQVERKTFSKTDWKWLGAVLGSFNTIWKEILKGNCLGMHRGMSGLFSIQFKRKSLRKTVWKCLWAVPCSFQYNVKGNL